MTQTVAEMLILATNALGTGILMFVAGVVQKIMNDIDELEFKRFLNRLGPAAMGDPFAVTVATLPIIMAVVYFVAYGFDHWWFTAGFVVWFVGGSITKLINMPIYTWVADPSHNDPEALRRQRRKLQFGNDVRAWTTLASVLLMASQFGFLDVVLVTAVAAIVAVPLLLLARRYVPGAAGAVSG